MDLVILSTKIYRAPAMHMPPIVHLRVLCFDGKFLEFANGFFYFPFYDFAVRVRTMILSNNQCILTIFIWRNDTHTQSIW